MNLELLLQPPQAVFLMQDEAASPVAMEGKSDSWINKEVTVWTRSQAASKGLAVSVHCPKAAISRVALRWTCSQLVDALFLGDHWERGYGDLQWRYMQPERLMPWYFAAHHIGDATTWAAGVKTGASAFCAWTSDPKGVTLWLDLRNGGLPSIPGDRVIEAATVVATESRAAETPIATIRRLCQKMCDNPRLPSAPVCGSNNWYYAYGHNFDQHQVLRDAALLAELAGDHTNRPYCVIDAGWSPGGSCPGGPWDAGRPDKFPDMPRLAEQIKQAGVRPGIWIRPTALTVITKPALLRIGPQPAAEKALDLTLPENLANIAADVARMHRWGFELIKHDFSTYDAFARWGFEMGAEMTDANWHFNDRSQTNAEIIRGLYQTLRNAAGDSVLIGCNTIGHLGAGLFELQRAGDDTSGQIWERTRRMGINTLAFRLPQHNTFFSIDADCVAHTDRTPWEKDRQFLRLVAHSGTSLFVSTDPTKITAEVKNEMTLAMQLALSGGSANVEPLDWLTTTCPEKWRFGLHSANESMTFDWTESIGAWPMKC